MSKEKKTNQDGWQPIDEGYQPPKKPEHQNNGYQPPKQSNQSQNFVPPPKKR
ncbi:hypothetical protein [Pantoea sp. WMus005]|uniref:hypothetical protein n=1 Tax=Pantoea sp. WMus005 TaxID=2750734 RepID=UPI0015CF8F8E|nr:hypothetical protein [Pantoea sp. WMus005]NYS31324.1 hypothetical protein [Pantoea sp. WMus005]